jgi:NADH-quinone oxidoreductase subunit N
MGTVTETTMQTEVFPLFLFSLGGMMVFTAANDLLTMFIALEVLSLPLYLMCGMARRRRLLSQEAAVKYFLLGAFSSAFFLYGVALLYGYAGSVTLSAIAEASVGTDRSDTLLFGGLALLVIGLLFKGSVGPFHTWTPDVYQGAPTPVTAFMSAATKVAALVLTLRILVVAFPGEEELWTWAIAAIAVVSLLWGNLAAIVQTDVKRMLAYSSVSHAGFLLIPIAAGNELGGRALLYYLIPYAAMSIGSFAIVAARERELARPVTLENLGGFGVERPAYAAAMAIFMFGFIGLPTSGLLLGKFYVFAAAYERGWTWLVIVGIVGTVISIYYYLGIVRAMYMSAPVLRAAPAGGSPPRDAPVAAVVAISVLVAVGSLVLVGPLIDLMRDSVAFLDFPF